MKRLLQFLRLKAASATAQLDVIPVDQGEDQSAYVGMLGSIKNLNQATRRSYTTVDDDTQTVTATAAAVVGGILNRTGSPGGAVTETTPTAAAIISALPRSVRVDNRHQWVFRYINNGLGQTTTWTAGTGVTITGTATIANNAWRDFLVSVDSSSAVTFQNIGGGTL